MDQDLAGALADGGFKGCAGDSEIACSRYRLDQRAAGFGFVTPDFYAIQIFRVSGFASAAFADRVTRVATVAHQVDAAAMFHCSTRSYFGFQPRAIPFDISEDAMKS
ncbi:hypothetical protein E0H68_06345 [Rhizobium leguminosarum bv. viciae]|uniref:hypothetical protein n=1 Tax=Rhizobium leguminosarum TaxID=384 RepID=UPI001038E5D0|nr:hypothetical protein [Rhizobium leguminosarum]TCA17390.1 hypothetical protein E0H68_06345 [Rhizobium leguminosarum bv. viciae]